MLRMSLNKRKDDMTSSETNTKKGQISTAAKSIAWIVEAGFRGFVGWVMLNFHAHNYVMAVAGVYALLTAFVIVVAHFVKAHK